MLGFPRTGSYGGGGGAVASVFGRTGAVVAAADDYEISEITGLTAALAAKQGLNSALTSLATAGLGAADYYLKMNGAGTAVEWVAGGGGGLGYGGSGGTQNYIQAPDASGDLIDTKLLYLDHATQPTLRVGSSGVYITNSASAGILDMNSADSRMLRPLSVGSSSFAPGAMLESRSSTGEQYRFSYDGSNYGSLECTSSGYAEYLSSGGWHRFLSALSVIISGSETHTLTLGGSGPLHYTNHANGLVWRVPASAPYSWEINSAEVLGMTSNGTDTTVQSGSGDGLRLAAATGYSLYLMSGSTNVFRANSTESFSYLPMRIQNSAAPQLALEYDGSNGVDVEVDLNGYLHVDSTGGFTYLNDHRVYMHSGNFRMYNVSSYWQFQNAIANKGMQWLDYQGNNVFWIDGAGANREFKVFAPKLGFYGVTTVTQPAHIDDADGTTGGNQTAINAILVALENLGLVAPA